MSSEWNYNTNFGKFLCRENLLPSINWNLISDISHAWQIFVVSNQFSALSARYLFGSKSEFYVGFIVFKRALLPDLTPCVMTGNKAAKCLLKLVGVYIEYSPLSFLRGSYLFVLTEPIKNRPPEEVLILFLCPFVCFHRFSDWEGSAVLVIEKKFQRVLKKTKFLRYDAITVGNYFCC